MNTTNNGINLTKYPLQSRQSSSYQSLIKNARIQLLTTGCATFPQFFTKQAILSSSKEAANAATTAFACDNQHNAFQLSGKDYSYDAKHPRNTFMRTRVASQAYDELDRQGCLYQLYNNDSFLKFVQEVTDQQELHRLADPLGACTVNIFKPGWYHAWHFDESEFTTTLCLQQSENGGEFEYTSPLRNDQSIDKCSSAVSAILNTHSEYNTSVPSTTETTDETTDETSETAVPVVDTKISDFQPGTLQIFAGRYSFHRVKEIPITATKDRLVAVLCFSTEPNVVNSAEVQQMFWGRSSL